VRPLPRVAWGMAVSLLVHSLVVALVWQRVPPAEAPRPQRMAVRLVAKAVHAPAAPLSIRQATHQPSSRVSAPAKKAAAKATTAPSPTVVAAHAPPALSPPQAPPEAIDGSVFGMPRIGFAGPSTPRWMTPPQPPAMPAPYPGPALAAQAHAAREAGRAQIVLALEHQVTVLPPPASPGDGACALQTQPESRLSCDTDALQEVVGAQVATLSGLLDAYRSMDPRASSLAIGYAQGRYRVSLGWAADVR